MSSSLIAFINWAVKMLFFLVAIFAWAISFYLRTKHINKPNGKINSEIKQNSKELFIVICRKSSFIIALFLTFFACFLSSGISRIILEIILEFAPWAVLFVIVKEDFPNIFNNNTGNNSKSNSKLPSPLINFILKCWLWVTIGMMTDILVGILL